MTSISPSVILSFEEARRTVESHSALQTGKGKETVPLLDACGRVLAGPVLADRDQPPFPRATRDGYAVRAADLATVPVSLSFAGEIKAGSSAKVRLQPGQAVSIMTGAPVPEGADAVLMVEYTARHGDRVHIERAVLSGENIVPEGAEARQGQQLLVPGTRIDHSVVALAASAGRSRLTVYAKPRVAVLATGDEIVDVDVSPSPSQIRNSNSYSLATQIQAAGGEPFLLPVAPDEPIRLRELLQEGLSSDLLLIAGGVSMGKYDLVEQSLTELNAEFFFTGAHIQPGKPIVFGRIRNGVYFFGLPGNPISTMVTFELFARPMIEALSGALPRPLLFTHARLKSEIRAKTGLKRFLPGLLSGQHEGSEVELVRWQGSGDIGSVARSNCYVVVPPDRERLDAGEWVPVLLR